MGLERLGPDDDINEFLDRLFNTATEQGSECEHLYRDEASPYCTKDLGEDEPSSLLQRRRLTCGTRTLQERCLAGPEQYQQCPYFNGKQTFSQ